MSSPIRPAKDADPALIYAPPWVRDQDRWPPESSPLPEQSSRRGDAALGDYEDRTIADTRLRRTLEPQWLPEAPQSSIGGRWWRVTLWAAGVFGFAALVAWAFVWAPGVRRLATEVIQTSLGSSISTDPKESNSLAAAIEQRAVRLRSEAAVSEKAVQQAADRPDPHEPVSAVAAIAPPPAVTAHEPVSAVAAIAPPPAVTAHEPPPKPPELVFRQLPADELASLLQRANDFIKSGDLSSARLLLRRAAEAGDAHAALTLASTFDPNVLKALGFQDAGADVAKARLWYERAVKFGSAEAPQRLQQLTTMSMAK
jgi:hypothetical protein